MATDFSLARHELIEHLRREVRDERVLTAMARVPREMFVPTSYWGAAYEDRPLPIGHGQTISQPLIVAMMTEALELEGDENVLEVGTGSGYQAAILAELARWVVTVERHRDLADKAAETLRKLGYTNVEVHLAEARLGWPLKAPYDAIVVSAGAPSVPKDLLDQLAIGGRLVIPVGSRYEQNLLKVVKKEHGTTTQDLGPCRWVPLIGESAWSNDGS
ncbi:MAG: protein-L-isoaspartate(D-aspartate) O-methyltransferase [Dehalococcoidia bacterium]|nr:protein-L-isoaspartate(D-aspartate) O-methyltransferase [Dehalococcoidia bacterium]